MELGITLQGRHVAGGLNVLAVSCPGGVEINGQSTPDIQVRVQDEAKAPHTLNSPLKSIIGFRFTCLRSHIRVQ